MSIETFQGNENQEPDSVDWNQESNQTDQTDGDQIDGNEEQDKISIKEINEDQIKSNMTYKQESLNLSTLYLGWNLRNDLIHTFIKLSSLISSRSSKMEIKKELSKVTLNLIQRLSVLLSNGTKCMLKENANIIDANLLEDVTDNDYDLIFEMNWVSRDYIVSLLMKNFNKIILYNDCLPAEDKEFFLKTNNGVVWLLLNLKTIPCENLNLIENFNFKDNQYISKGTLFKVYFLFDFIKI